MNSSKYGIYLNQYYGVTTCRSIDGIYVMDFQDFTYSPWELNRLNSARHISWDPKCFPLLHAVKFFFKSEAPCTVVCKQDTWTILLGKERVVIPVAAIEGDENDGSSSSSAFQLYVTPFYAVDTLDDVRRYLRGIGAVSGYDNVFGHRDSVFFLDGNAIPAPGACYFDGDKTDASDMYRICILSREPVETVVAAANEWKNNASVDAYPFITRSTVATPAMVDFRHAEGTAIFFPDHAMVESNTLQKRLSLENPRFLIQDILTSYYRLHLRKMEDRRLQLEGEKLKLEEKKLRLQEERQNFDEEAARASVDSEISAVAEAVAEAAAAIARIDAHDFFENLGLVIEWPFNVTYEGSKFAGGGGGQRRPQEERFVRLAVNGPRSTRVLLVRQPYERYVEYDEVPNTSWTNISYVQKTLRLPPEMEKVSVYGTVIGVVYQKTFFCLDSPLLEGIPSPSESRNMRHLLAISINNKKLFSDRDLLHVVQTYELVPRKYRVHRVLIVPAKLYAWCITKVPKSSSESSGGRQHPAFVKRSPLLHAWVNLCEQNFDAEKPEEVVDTELIRLALALLHHKICFKTEIVYNKDQSGKLKVTDKDATLMVGPNAALFLNEARVQDDILDDEVKSALCTLM